MMRYFDNLIDTVVKYKKCHFWLFFIVLILLSCIMDYYFKDSLYGDDFNFHYRRICVLIDVFKEGIFPNYTDYEALDGYGYFTNGFYSDFLLIPFAFIASVVNLDPLYTFRLLIVVITVFSGVFTYLSVNKIYKNTFIAFVSGILFAFCYYKLCNSYNRAALGETMAMSFLPLVILGLYELIKGDYKKWYIFTIACSLLLFSHVITPVLVAVVVIVFLVIYRNAFFKEPKRFAYLILSCVYTVIVTACFLLPLFEQLLSNTFFVGSAEKRYSTIAVGMPLKFIIKGMFSGITGGSIFGIGILLTWLVSLRFFLFKTVVNLKNADIFLIVGLALFLLISPLYPWHIFPFSKFNFIQFSWRFYTIISLLFSVSGAVYLYYLLQTTKRRVLIGIPLVICMNIVIFMCFSEIIKKADFSISKPSIENDYLISGAEYLPEKIPFAFADFIHNRGTDSIAVKNSDTQINDFDRNNIHLHFNVNTSSPDILELPLIYYKGYEATIDGRPIAVSESDNGLVQIQLDHSGSVNVWFEGTFVKNISLYVSILAIFFLCCYIIFYKQRIVR